MNKLIYILMVGFALFSIQNIQAQCPPTVAPNLGIPLTHLVPSAQTTVYADFAESSTNYPNFPGQGNFGLCTGTQVLASGVFVCFEFSPSQIDPNLFGVDIAFSTAAGFPTGPVFNTYQVDGGGNCVPITPAGLNAQGYPEYLPGTVPSGYDPNQSIYACVELQFQPGDILDCVQIVGYGSGNTGGGQCNLTEAIADVLPCDANGTNFPNEGDDFYTVNLTLSYTDIDGDVMVNGVVASPSPPPISATSQNFTATLPADGTSPNLIITLGSGAGNCTVDLGQIGPLDPCSPSCDVTYEVIGGAGYNECQNIQDEFDAAGGFGGFPNFDGADDPCVYCSASAISVTNLPANCAGVEVFYESYAFGANATIDACNGIFDGQQVDDDNGMPYLGADPYNSHPDADGCSPVYYTVIQSFAIDGASSCVCDGVCLQAEPINVQVFPDNFTGYSLVSIAGDCENAPSVEVYPTINGTPETGNGPCQVIVDADFSSIPACNETGVATIDVTVVDSELQALAPLTDICIDFTGVEVPYSCICATCPEYDYAAVDVCSGTAPTFTQQNPNCTLQDPPANVPTATVGYDLDLYIYAPGGFPGEAPVGYDPLPGSGADGFPVYNTDLISEASTFDQGDDCTVDLIASTLVNTTCAPITVTYFILPFSYYDDLNNDGTVGAYVGSTGENYCPPQRIDVTIYPDVLFAQETPGTCDVTASVQVFASNGDICGSATDAGPIAPPADCGMTNSGTFAYDITAADLGLGNAPMTCQQSFTGAIAKSCDSDACIYPCIAGGSVTTSDVVCCDETVNITNTTTDYDGTLAGEDPGKDYQLGYAVLPAGAPVPGSQADIDGAAHVFAANADDGTDDGGTMLTSCADGLGFAPVATGCYDVYPFVSMQELRYAGDQNDLSVSIAADPFPGQFDAYINNYVAENCADNSGIMALASSVINVNVDDASSLSGCVTSYCIDLYKNGAYVNTVGPNAVAVATNLALTPTDFGGITSNDNLDIIIAVCENTCAAGQGDAGSDFFVDYTIDYELIFEPQFPDLGEGDCCLSFGEATRICIVDDINATSTISCVDEDTYEVVVTPAGGTPALTTYYPGHDYEVTDPGAINITSTATGNFILTYNYGTNYNITIKNVDIGGLPVVSQSSSDGCARNITGNAPVLPAVPTTTNSLICSDGSNVNAGELVANCAACPSGNAVSVSWWDADSGGNNLASGGTFDPVPQIADPSAPGAYSFWTRCECDGCPSARTEVVYNVYALPILTLNNTACRPGGAGNYDVTLDVDLGTWNSILDGTEASYSVISSAGTPLNATISASGTVLIEDVPAGTPVTVTIVTGMENNGCSTALLVEPSLCCPTTVDDFSGAEDQCIDALAAPAIADFADIIASIDVLGSEIVVWEDVTTGLEYVGGVTPPAPIYTGDGCQPQVFAYNLHIRCADDPNISLDGGTYELTVWPIPTVTENTANCEIGVTNDCPNGYVLYDNDQDGNYTDSTPPTITAGTVIVDYYAAINMAPTGCGLAANYTASCNCDLSIQEIEIDQGNNGGTGVNYYNRMEIDIYNGILPYTYDWDQIGYVRFAEINQEDPMPYPDGDRELRVIYADNAYWSVTITDHVGCQVIATNDPPAVGGVQEVLDIAYQEIIGDNCHTGNQAEGSIKILTEFGTPPYDYEWTGPITWTGNITGMTGTPWTGGGGPGEEHEIATLPYGWYAVTITDSGIDDFNDPRYFDAEGNPVIDDDPNTPLPQQTTEAWFWVECIRPSGRGKSAEDVASLSASPNPFNDATTIEFSIPETGHTTIELYSLTGQKMLNLYDGQLEKQEIYTMHFDAGPLASGMYMMKLTSETGQEVTHKLVIAK